MITALIIWAFRKYIAPKVTRKRNSSKALHLRFMLFIFMLSSCYTHLYAAEEVQYTITRNGAAIGRMSCIQNRIGSDLYLKISSKVNTRFVIKFDVQTEDIAHFKAGKLMSSEISRVVNGNAKEPRRTDWANHCYRIQSGEKSGVITRNIDYNMMLLYLKEPVHMEQVYSDNFQCFLAIIRTGANQYRVKLPDKSYNDYFFENGQCKRVILTHSLYTIKMERI